MQDLLQDDSFKLNESFTNSFVNELSKVHIDFSVCDIGY